MWFKIVQDRQMSTWTYTRSSQVLKPQIQVLHEDCHSMRHPIPHENCKNNWRQPTLHPFSLKSSKSFTSSQCSDILELTAHITHHTIQSHILPYEYQHIAYIYIYVYIYIYIYTYIHIYIYIYIYIYLFIHNYIYTYIYVCVHIQLNMYVSAYANIYYDNLYVYT